MYKDCDRCFRTYFTTTGKSKFCPTCRDLVIEENLKKHRKDWWARKKAERDAEKQRGRDASMGE